MIFFIKYFLKKSFFRKMLVFSGVRLSYENELEIIFSYLEKKIAFIFLERYALFL